MAFSRFRNNPASDGELIRRRYDRLAPWFDCLEGFMEGLYFRRLRQRLWAQAAGTDVLEVGVGTGKNFPYYPESARVTAIDFSRRMLAQAQRKRDRKQIAVDLVEMNAETICYADNSFDTIVASFVFCSIPHPSKALRELYRVLKPGGQLLLLEHVLSGNRLLAAAMNFLNPLVVRLFGANINRQTVKLVQSCPFHSIHVAPESGDIVKMIRAIK